MAKTLNNLYNSTDKGRLKRADNVQFKHFKTLISKKNPAIHEYHYWTGTDEYKYKTTIRPLNPLQYDLNAGNAPAMVSCSCEDFKYRLEYSLSLSRNAQIKYSNGQPANITNPTNKKFMCKHLISIFDSVLKLNKKNVEMLNNLKISKYLDISSEYMSKDIKKLTKNIK